MSTPVLPPRYETASMSHRSFPEGRAAIDTELELRNSQMKKEGATKLVTQYVSANGKVLRTITENL